MNRAISLAIFRWYPSHDLWRRGVKMIQLRHSSTLSPLRPHLPTRRCGCLLAVWSRSLSGWGCCVDQRQTETES